MKKKLCCLITRIILSTFICLLVFPEKTLAEETTNYEDYVNILYNSENGLPTSEANDIVQTSDGFIWVGSYSGLIRYDGVEFQRISDTDGVSNANKLYADSNDRLWIGTNDKGIMNYEDGQYTVYNTLDGLKSNSVKDIKEDSKGNLYVATTAGINYIDLETGEVIGVAESILSKAYINSIEVLPDDTVIVVTASGEIYGINEEKTVLMHIDEISSKNMAISVSADDMFDGWMIGTEGNQIFLCTGDIDKFSYQQLACGNLERVNYLNHIKDGTLWACTDNGVGYFDNSMTFHELRDFQMNNSVDNMIQDYEGNLWFASSRQGVFKCTPNYFVNLNKKAGFEDNVVNSCINYKGKLYMATDEGLKILDQDNQSVENNLTDYLSNVRIRCLMVDHQEQLWLCTYGDTGLVSYNGEDITSIGQEQGIETAKLRSVIETSDDHLWVATSNGIYILKDGKVEKHIGMEDGLTNQEILTICEAGDGSIYVGTDGGGVCQFVDGELVKTITEDNGLLSGIIMRIRYDRETGGLWMITSNSISYVLDEKVRNISKFPYSNNYDFYFGDNDTFWILSSNGLYVTQRESMLSDGALRYTFYDYNSGMPCTPTANSFSYIDEDNEIFYICGSSGIYSMQMNIEDDNNMLTKLAIPSVILDGETKWVLDDEVTVPSDVKRMRIDAYALCYGLQNPLIKYYLDGFDTDKEVVRKSEFKDVVYTNLSGGDYCFHIEVIDPATNEAVITKTLYIHKEYQLSERLSFWVLIITFFVIVIALVVFFLMRYRMNLVILKKEEKQKKTLANALEMAENANKAKTEFLSRMSHDLRTPMNAVIGISKLGMEECEEEKAVDYFQKINNSGNYLLGLINDVLDMSRIESGKVEFREDCVERIQFCENVLTMLAPLIKARNIKIKYRYDYPMVKYVYCDKIRMEQIYMNLLSNAIKYSAPNSIVEWTATDIEKKDGYIYTKVIIKDYGCGMSKEFMKKIFEPFAQECNQYSGETASSGLGLAICKNTIEQMGGTIDVESELGKGSTFTLFISNRISDHAPEVIENKEIEDSILLKKHILLVEDHPLNMEIARKILEKKNMKITTADDGIGAVEVFEKSAEGEFDAVLMDIRMPHMDGLEATKVIRAMNRKDALSIPIIAMTANAYEEDKELCKAAGMNAHLSKPMNTRELYSVLAFYLKK